MTAHPTPPPDWPAWTAASFASTSLDATVRQSLARLDARRATPSMVQDALASSGIRVTLTWAHEWLKSRRGRR